MPRFQSFVESLEAPCASTHRRAGSARPSRPRFWRSLDPCTERITRTMSPGELRASLREVVASPAETIELAIQDGVAEIRPAVPEEFRDTLVAYLELLPEVIRQALRRPGDPDGTSVPEQFVVHRAEDWLLFLPDRLPIFRPGDVPAGLDSWRVEGLRGLGPHAEVWDGYDDEQPELSPACLKFITDPKAREAFLKQVPVIKRVDSI